MAKQPISPKSPRRKRPICLRRHSKRSRYSTGRPRKAIRFLCSGNQVPIDKVVLKRKRFEVDDKSYHGKLSQFQWDQILPVAGQGTLAVLFKVRDILSDLAVLVSTDETTLFNKMTGGSNSKRKKPSRGRRRQQADRLLHFRRRAQQTPDPGAVHDVWRHRLGPERPRLLATSTPVAQEAADTCAHDPGTPGDAEWASTENPALSRAELGSTFEHRAEAQRWAAERLICPSCHHTLGALALPRGSVHCEKCGASFRVERVSQASTIDEIRVIGRFQLLDRVGQGSFGTVWRARDQELERVVAVKVPHAHALESGLDAERWGVKHGSPRSSGTRASCAFMKW